MDHSAPLSLRLKESFQKATILDPTTRSDSDRIPQLDLLRAETSLPRDQGLISQLAYPQLEELMVRQGFPTETNWKHDDKFQQALEQGVSPLFISDDEPGKIRRLQRDIKSIQAAGL